MKRKQQHSLDADDRVRKGFLNKINSEVILSGLGNSDTEVALAVPAGGTGAQAFTDQKLVYYDAGTKRLKSSPYSHDVLAAVTGDMLGAAWHTGVKLSSTIVDTITDLTTDDTEVMTASFAKEANTIWAAFRVVFSFTLAGNAGTGVENIRLTLGDDTPGSTLYVSNYAGPFVTAAVDDTLTYTWIAEGVITDAINASHQEFDNPLIVRVWMRGGLGDVKTKRAGYVRVEDRGLNANRVPAPELHGVPVFISPQVVYRGMGNKAWTTFNCAPIGVPENATGVILQCYGQCGGPNIVLGSALQVRVRRSAAPGEAYQYVLASFRAAGNSDETATASQGIFPLSDATSFDYMASDNYLVPTAGNTLNGTPAAGESYINLYVIGYIT